MTEIRQPNENEIETLSKVASAIVKEHYDPLLGSEQNDYMIAMFQSESGIRKQIAEGYRYYWILEDGKEAGFFAMYPKCGKMYLSKFYISKEYRGQGLGRKAFDFIQCASERECLTHIFLNVNRGNTDSIKIYEHLGFRIVREEKNDIGRGFYMDDYVMETPVKQ